MGLPPLPSDDENSTCKGQLEAAAFDHRGSPLATLVGLTCVILTH